MQEGEFPSLTDFHKKIDENDIIIEEQYSEKHILKQILIWI